MQSKILGYNIFTNRTQHLHEYKYILETSISDQQSQPGILYCQWKSSKTVSPLPLPPSPNTRHQTTSTISRILKTEQTAQHLLVKRILLYNFPFGNNLQFMLSFHHQLDMVVYSSAKSVLFKKRRCLRQGL